MKSNVKRVEGTIYWYLADNGLIQWDTEEFHPIDYLSIFISYNCIIITENKISNKKGNYTYLNSVTERDIPYKTSIFTDDKIIKIEDNESLEYLVKIKERDEIIDLKNFIQNNINENLGKFFGKKGWSFKLGGGFHLYPLDIEIYRKDFNQYIDKYFFK